jgi:hypothetical protein
MPQQLFVFVQFEFPWQLGPADGRYLLRDGPDGEAEHVVVIETLAATRSADGTRPSGWLARRMGAREREAAPEPPAAAVASTRVTVIDPLPLSAELQAQAWLADLDRERDVQAAARVANRVVQSHRIASADPYAREVAAGAALVTRAGWGEGEQVAMGQWLHALELPPRGVGRSMRRRRERSWALRPQERLAALLGGRSQALLCEELTLRARLDLDEGRPRHAAVELDRALRAAVAELRAERREDLALRVAELEQLAEGVRAQADAALAAQPVELDEEALSHALGRVEAALRARSAAGFAAG